MLCYSQEVFGYVIETQLKCGRERERPRKREREKEREILRDRERWQVKSCETCKHFLMDLFSTT